MLSHQKQPPAGSSPFRTLTLPALLVAFAFAILAIIYSSGDIQVLGRNISSHLFEIFATLSWAAGAFLLIRLIDVAVWRGLMRMHGYHAPHLLRELVAALIWYWAACAIVSFVFGQSLTAVVAASTVAMGIIGFALQRPILDGFSGIVLALQQPFKVGDWLQVDEKGSLGRVVEMNWRAVHLITADEIVFVIPNGQFISQAAKVYSRPKHYFRDHIELTLPYAVTTHQGQRILLGSANQVEEIAALPRKPIVTILDYTDRGILWRLLYWCPDAGRLPVFRFQVHQNILRNLYYAGIEIPMPVRDLRRIPHRTSDADEAVGIDPLLMRVSLFAGLTAEELRYLSAQAVNRLVEAGKPLLRQGDDGDSLFVLREGTLEVSITDGPGEEIVVGRIHPGQFFGEKSLLLGEKRSATVTPTVDATVVEVTRETMSHLMQGRPELATYLGEVLAERQLKTSAKIHARHDHLPATESLLDHMVKNIRSFFGLTEPAAS